MLTSLTRTFGERVSWKILGPNKDELKRGGEICKSRRIRCAGHATRMWEITNAYKTLVRKNERQRSHRRFKRDGRVSLKES
jgi:hypothetical protein